MVLVDGFVVGFVVTHSHCCFVVQTAYFVGRFVVTDFCQTHFVVELSLVEPSLVEIAPNQMVLTLLTQIALILIVVSCLIQN